MILKRIFPFILFLCLFVEIVAQEVKVSPSQKLTNKISSFKLLGRIGNDYVVERYGDSKHIFDIYSNSLDYKTSKEFEETKHKKYHKTWLLPDGGWLSFVEKTKESSVLKAVSISSKFILSEKEIVLDTIKEKADMVVTNLRSKTSLNESHIAYYMPVFESGSVDYFLVNVYDIRMTLVQSQKLYHTEIKNSNFADIEIFNDGSFVLIMQDTEEKPIHSGDVSYHLFYAPVGEDVIYHSYTPQDDIFKKPKFEIDNINKKLLIAGFYQYPFSKKRDVSANRFFSVDLSLETGETFYHVEQEFSADFYFNLTGGESETNVLYTFYIKEIIAKSDGGKIVVAESYYKEQEQTYSNSVFGSPTYNNYVPVNVYYYNDLIVYDIDDKGDIATIQIVNKRQSSEDDRGAYSSFFTMNEQDKIRLLFLEDIDPQSAFNEYVFSNTAIEETKSLFNVGSKAILPLPKMAVQTAPNELIIPSFMSNEVSLVKMTFSE